MAPQQPQDLTTITYRLTTVEQQVQALHTQLQLYVPVRENDLQLQAIKSTVERIEIDVSDTKKQVGSMRDAQNAMREAQDKLQIRILLAIVTTIVTILGGVFVGYVTHLFH